MGWNHVSAGCVLSRSQRDVYFLASSDFESLPASWTAAFHPHSASAVISLIPAPNAPFPSESLVVCFCTVRTFVTTSVTYAKTISLSQSPSLCYACKVPFPYLQALGKKTHRSLKVLILHCTHIGAKKFYWVPALFQVWYFTLRFSGTSQVNLEINRWEFCTEKKEEQNEERERPK